LSVGFVGELNNVTRYATWFFPKTPLGNPEKSATGRDELVSAMQRVITETLQETVLFPVQGVQIHPPSQYNTFAQFIQSLRGVNNRVAFITFNYDVALDYALYFYSLNPDYGLLDTQDGATAVLRSVNFLIGLKPGMLFQSSTRRAAGHWAANSASSLSVVNRSVLPSGIASSGP
jgi:hypothetical protein